MMFVSSGSSALWQTLGEGKAHRVYGKRHNGSKPDAEGTSLKARDEEEDGDDDDEGEEDEMVLRRRKRKRGDGLDRFVWSNGRECRDVDGTRDVLQRDTSNLPWENSPETSLDEEGTFCSMMRKNCE